MLKLSKTHLLKGCPTNKLGAGGLEAVAPTQEDYKRTAGTNADVITAADCP